MCKKKTNLEWCSTTFWLITFKSSFVVIFHMYIPAMHSVFQDSLVLIFTMSTGKTFGPLIVFNITTQSSHRLSFHRSHVLNNVRPIFVHRTGFPDLLLRFPGHSFLCAFRQWNGVFLNFSNYGPSCVSFF